MTSLKSLLHAHCPCYHQVPPIQYKLWGEARLMLQIEVGREKEIVGPKRLVFTKKRGGLLSPIHEEGPTIHFPEGVRGERLEGRARLPALLLSLPMGPPPSNSHSAAIVQQPPPSPSPLGFQAFPSLAVPLPSAIPVFWILHRWLRSVFTLL